MNNPVVSIIIPVYNVEKYLRKCLNSVISQTLRDIEIICVNDGTKDNSVAILEEYAAKDSRIKIVHKENGGLSSARNEGMKYAAAGLIGFLDSDDWIEPDAYELAYRAITEYNVDLVCWYAQIETEDNTLDSAAVEEAKRYHAIKNTGIFDVYDDLFLNCTVTVWNKLFKKSIIESYHISFPVGLLHEDNEFFIKYAVMCKKIFFIDRYLIHYLQRLGSIMWTKQPQNKTGGLDRIKVMKNLCSYFVKYKKVEEFRATLSRQLIWGLFANQCYRTPKEELFYVFKQTRDAIKDIDIKLLKDSKNMLFNLKHKKYAALYAYFNNGVAYDGLLNKLKKTIPFKILKKIYHQTSYYKIKTLRSDYRKVECRIKAMSSKLEEILESRR